jgi:DNA-binding Lrp family transcriptional regulator
MTKLDAIDLRILAVLQQEGRITNAALAQRVHLSPSPCLARTKRLEEAGLITGYGARIDLARLGETLTVFTEVTLEDHRAENFRAFETGIAEFPEVVECHLISGGYDYLLKFICRGVQDYQDSIGRVLDAGLGIAKYFSYVVIKSPIAGRPVPVGRIAPT